MRDQAVWPQQRLLHNTGRTMYSIKSMRAINKATASSKAVNALLSADELEVIAHALARGDHGTYILDLMAGYTLGLSNRGIDFYLPGIEEELNLRPIDSIRTEGHKMVRYELSVK